MLLSHRVVHGLAGSLAAFVVVSAGAAPPGTSGNAAGSVVLERRQHEALQAQLSQLQAEVKTLREELARARLEAGTAQRELDELRQFMLDHDAYGADFEKYRGFLAIAEREARRRAAEEQRQQREAERLERKKSLDAARAEQDAAKAVQKAEAARLQQYRDAGLDPISDDVFVTRMAYRYKHKDVVDRDQIIIPWRVTYIGTSSNYFWYRPVYTVDVNTEVDYTEMTLTGSVVSAAPEARDLSIAIAFFDRNNNQIGGKTIELNDVRPDVPYPFTEKLPMASGRPFDSYRIIVQRSDPAEKTGTP